MEALNELAIVQMYVLSDSTTFIRESQFPAPDKAFVAEISQKLIPDIVSASPDIADLLVMCTALPLVAAAFPTTIASSLGLAI